MTPLFPKRPLAAVVVASIVALGGTPARAEVLKDPQWQALAEARKFPELEQVSSARLSAKPDDGEAWLAYTQSVLSLRGDTASARRDAALVKLQACVKATPQIAACHYGLGAVTGVQVMTQGLMKAAFGVGQVRDEFIKALEIDPQFFSARSGLVQFYLMAPGIAGGSVAKARDTAQAAAARQPEYAKVLNAAILQYDDKPADAERLLASVQAGADASLAEEVRGQWVSLGFGYLEARQAAKARAVFERVAKDKPDLVEGHYGLARAELQAAAKLPGHDALPIDHRLGVALEGKGDVAQAKAAYVRFLALPGQNPRNVDDVKKRLAALG
jgi:Tfp pilus assembly protein PilF